MCLNGSAENLLSKSSSNIDFEEWQMSKTWRFLLVKDLHHTGKPLSSNRYGLGVTWQSVTRSVVELNMRFTQGAACWPSIDLESVFKLCSS